MEPKALTNMNGTLVTPAKNNAATPRDSQTAPNGNNNRVMRRDSVEWMHSPPEHVEGEDSARDRKWEEENFMLSPVPKTPAPEAIAQYARDLPPETPASASGFDYEEDSPSEAEELLMRTCPPKQTRFADPGPSGSGEKKDESLFMRLMAARRKSLQFAPKIASPLSKAWN